MQYLPSHAEFVIASNAVLCRGLGYQEEPALILFGPLSNSTQYLTAFRQSTSQILLPTVTFPHFLIHSLSAPLQILRIRHVLRAGGVLY